MIRKKRKPISSGLSSTMRQVSILLTSLQQQKEDLIIAQREAIRDLDDVLTTMPEEWRLTDQLRTIKRNLIFSYTDIYTKHTLTLELARRFEKKEQ